jgi:enolase
MKGRIESVRAREVLDSRGMPTVEVEVTLAGGASARSSVPAGASTGRHEAVELRDGDPARYRGKGVRRAVANVNELIGPDLVGRDALDQSAIDALLCELDGTESKSRLGANALLGVSLAVASAAAAARGLPLWRSLGGEEVCVLPLPMINVISGGLHARGNLDFQDFLIVPVGAQSVGHALELASAVYAQRHRTSLDLARHARIMGTTRMQRRGAQPDAGRVVALRQRPIVLDRLPLSTAPTERIDSSVIGLRGQPRSPSCQHADDAESARW